MSNGINKLSEESDEKLMQLYQEGSSMAFDEIYRRFAKRVYQYFFTKTHVVSLAQDLTQEMFLKMHRSRELYRSSMPLAPWIFTISRSVFLDNVKRKKIETVSLQDEVLVESLSDVGSAEFNLEVLKLLPSEQEKVISRRIVDEASFDEIADELKISSANARQIFSRGLKKLRDRFKKKEQM